MRNTYDLWISTSATRSDAALLYASCARKPNGAMMIKQGSKEREAMGAGVLGTMRFESFHRGAGQLFIGDPHKYWDSYGWDATEPGLIKLLGQRSTAQVIAAGVTTVGRGAMTADGTVPFIICIPTNIYEGDPGSGAPTAKLAPDGSNKWSGSTAIFGDRIFFGSSASVSGGGNSGRYGVKNITAQTYALASDAGTLDEASFFASTGTKLFRVRVSGRVAYISWTAQTGADVPTWGTEYQLPLGDRTVKDIAVIGPHLLIAIGGGNQPGQVVSIDDEGSFTPLIPEGMGVNTPLMFVPYLGGQMLLIQQRVQALWFRDLLDVAPVSWNAAAYPDETLFTTSTYAATAQADRVYTVPIGNNYAHVYAGQFDGTAWAPHQLLKQFVASPSGTLAARIYDTGTARQLQVVVVEGGQTCLRRLDIWDDNTPPGTMSSSIRTFYTSTLTGPVSITKLFTRIRVPVMAKSAYGGGGQAVVSLTLYVDDVNVGVFYVTGGAGMNFESLDLKEQTNALGRSLYLKIACHDADLQPNQLVVHTPIEVDFYAVPDQADVLRIPILIGANTMTAGGTVDRRSRNEILETVKALCTAQTVRYLHWADGRNLWMVVPMSYEEEIIQSTGQPSQDQSVVWLTVQRV